MKGFNLALPGSQGMTGKLPPVAEFTTPFHSGSENNDFYGSSFAGLLNANAGITPRRNPMYSMQQYSSSQSSFSESFGPIGRLGKIGSKLRNTSQKRRWGRCRPLINVSMFLFLFRWFSVQKGSYVEMSFFLSN